MNAKARQIARRMEATADGKIMAYAFEGQFTCIARRGTRWFLSVGPLRSVVRDTNGQPSDVHCPPQDSLLLALRFAGYEE